MLLGIIVVVLIVVICGVTALTTNKSQKNLAEPNFYSTQYDSLRPCKGKNSNVCVAEGCYDNACVRLAVKK